ncbi:hypothetical protein SUDANB140_06888 [Streptomyces sp. enrichment culture]
MPSVMRRKTTTPNARRPAVFFGDSCTGLAVINS